MTKVRAAVLLLALSGTAPAARAQAADTTSAAWVVEMFYARPSFPGLAAHVTGEYAQNYADAATMGSRLPPEVAVTSRPLRLEADLAIFVTHLRDSERARDWYTFLRREGGAWKISEVRSFVPQPIYEALVQDWEERRSRRDLPDSLVSVLETIRLTAASDSALAAYLLAHEPAFRALAERFAAARELTSLSMVSGSTGNVTPADTHALKEALHALHLSGVLRRQEEPGCLFLVIGGLGDNEVGYIHAPPGCTPPLISPGGYIYVEQVAPGWYLYRTT